MLELQSIQSPVLTLALFPKGPYKVKDNCSDSVLVNIAGETFTDYGCDSANIQE
ncbi:MAG: hypothetical protein IPF93_25330 [Saprospiraceae bacterium]|nr:hypothetical protein [Saprospiraceae bacterium]